jgi:hypothetical protein
VAGHLHGVPIAIKELFDVAHLPATHGSQALAAALRLDEILDRELASPRPAHHGSHGSIRPEIYTQLGHLA